MPRVLLVDDEPGIRFALKRWFERQQWTVIEAADGQHALSELLASRDGSPSRIDVIICDLNLPLLSGEQLRNRLLADRPELVDRLILTTGDAVDDAAPGSAVAEHAHVLQKPFDLATLRTVVQSIVA